MNERRFEEEFLGYDKYSSNMCSNDESDLHRGSNDRNVSHEHMRRKGTQKYLRKSCYHCIKCTKATFLAAFMWRRLLNSVALTITTHRKPNRVFDGTDTQVKDQTINKCRIRMVQRELYNIRDPPWGRDQKIKKETL